MYHMFIRIQQVVGQKSAMPYDYPPHVANSSPPKAKNLAEPITIAMSFILKAIETGFHRTKVCLM